MTMSHTQHRPLYLAIATAFAVNTTALTMNMAYAQDQANASAKASAPAIEEVLVFGRLQSSAQSIIDERMDQPFSADLLGTEQISRAGDSNVAAALMRVTGVTLVEDQYVYVRSLGERYSSTQLNGAAVPSPELTRNVLPLDVIPASIVESLKIQKAWSPDLPANFGGGNIDIRTKSTPDDVVFKYSLGTGTNSGNRDGGLQLSGPQTKGMPNAIHNALDTYAGGTLSIVEIQNKAHVSREQAQILNRELALSLNRKANIEEKTPPADLSFGLDVGNSWDVSDDFTAGALVSLSRDREYRNKYYSEQSIGAPENNYSKTERSVDEVKELASLNTGLNYQDDHKISLNGYLIINTEDEAMIERGHNTSNEAGNGDQYINYDTRHEQRELTVMQVIGDHIFDQLNGDVLGDIHVDWFNSDSTANTDIPLQSRVQGVSRINPETGEQMSTALLSTTSVASYSFLELEDQVRSRGINLDVPMNFGKAEITLSSGYSYNDKSREYYGYTANINSAGVTSDILTGTPINVLTDAKLGNLNNSFDFSLGTGLGTESYLAGQITDAAYGMVDINWDYRWRVALGARYENFREALLPINLLDYSYVQDLVDELGDDAQSLGSNEDDWYPSLAITFMNEGFMGTDNFQVRGSVSQTVVRPDLREKSDVSFINEDRLRVFGNTSLVSSQIDHFDLRTEWFYGSGDNFTASLFYKDLTDPIEQSRRPGSDDNIELEFYNALSGEIYGLELEGLKSIGAGFFVSSNLTLSESEIISPDDRGFTNVKRSMSGHSEYVLNTQLGFDSDNGEHSLSAVYNVFGERVYYAARNNGHDDAFEQPFHSLDIVYNYYPAEAFTVKAKVSNILNQHHTYEQTNNDGKTVTVLDRETGTGFGLELSYSY